MEALKELSTLLEPDDRWMAVVLVNHTTNEARPISISDIYESISEIEISAKAPDEVQSQFNVARMLGIYSWLYYPFHQAAELKAYSTAELALRLRFPTIKGGLYKLLTHAVSIGVISDEGFEHIKSNTEDPARFSRQLPKYLSYMRNVLAHGSPTLHPESPTTLRICAAIINQLYLPPENPSPRRAD